VRLAIDVRRLPWVSRLSADYAFDFSKLARFYPGDPAHSHAWADAIRRARTHRRDRSTLADAVAAQQGRRGAPAEARAAAARLAGADTVAVVTGQQAGLFGGPLYTLLKALTAVRLAARVTADHGVPAVAVFWVESEDHDWQEVSSCAVLDAEMNRRAISLGTPPGAGGTPVSSVVLDPSILAALDGLRATLPPTEFTEATLDGLSRAYRPGAGMSEAFGAWLESLLGRFGLVVYDSSDPSTKRDAADFFARELATPATTRLALARARALIDLGYHAQVVPHDDAVALFALDGTRQPILARDGAFLVGDRLVPAADLVDRARRHPERFSPNVLLRPIIQDALFPTVCYVAGPSELAYLGELGPVYEHFGVPQPLVAPRATVTLLDSAAAKFLANYEIALEALQPDNETALNRLLEAQLPAAIEEAHAGASQAVEDGMARLIEALPLVDATLAGAARSALGRMQHDLRALHEKIVQAAKRRNETLRRQFGRTRALTFPDGHPQERAIGFVSFLNRYGPALVDRLHDDLSLDAGSHWVLTP
jgi:bacillithiol biosynthesis cysteine-adding enzyme BshC